MSTEIAFLLSLDSRFNEPAAELNDAWSKLKHSSARFNRHEPPASWNLKRQRCILLLFLISS